MCQNLNGRTGQTMVFINYIIVNSDIICMFQGLMPIHCCAMQGRIDVIHALLKSDEHGEIRKELASEKSKSPPSLVHLAVANDFVDCGQW